MVELYKNLLHDLLFLDVQFLKVEDTFFMMT
jgi:hypothetical protein